MSTTHSHNKLLRLAAVCGLAALALMSWSFLDPRPIPVIAAMSIGQVLGTIALWGAVVIGVLELRRSRRVAHAELRTEATTAKAEPSGDDEGTP